MLASSQCGGVGIPGCIPGAACRHGSFRNGITIIARNACPPVRMGLSNCSASVRARVLGGSARFLQRRAAVTRVRGQAKHLGRYRCPPKCHGAGGQQIAGLAVLWVTIGTLPIGFGRMGCPHPASPSLDGGREGGAPSSSLSGPGRSRFFGPAATVFRPSSMGAPGNRRHLRFGRQALLRWSPPVPAVLLVKRSGWIGDPECRILL